MQRRIKEIFGGRLSKDFSETDRQEMLSLFHDPEIEFELKNELLEQLNNNSVDENSTVDYKNLFEKIWNKINESKQSPKPGIRWLYPALKIAAVLVIGLIIGNFIQKINNKETVSYYTANCPKGSVSSLVLPDSTIIYLNAGSKIRYSVDGKDKNREVFLDGEAWFHVAKNPKKAFVVYTSIYDITVTGTKFDVKAYEADNYISTTLEEGEVKISSSEKFKLQNDLILKPGQQATFDKENKVFRVVNVNAGRFSSWKDNQLIFVNMTLKELQVLLERRYGVDIVVKDKDLLNLHFDGVIKNESILEIMDILKYTLSIDYVIVDQTIEIKAKKQE